MRITKTKVAIDTAGEEFCVMAWITDANGIYRRYEDADYFTNDRDDAFATAHVMSPYVVNCDVQCDDCKEMK